MMTSELNSVTKNSTESQRELLARKLRQKAAASCLEYPLSYGQSALLFLHRMAPQSPAYNVAFVARIVSEVDTQALEKALQRLVDRHAVLRTTYSRRDRNPRQIVHGAMDVGFEQVDASSWSEEELRDRVHAKFSKPYDLEKGPIVRPVLFTRSVNDHVLLFGTHHIAYDGWSQGIILNELQELYAAYTQHRSPNLPNVGMSYVESVKRRSEILEAEKGRKLWEYWEKTLGGDLPPLDLPTDYPRPDTSRMEGDSCPFSVGEECYEKLMSLAKAEGVTFYTLVLAAFQVLLMDYTGKQEILVGTPMAARSEQEFENIVGYFINSVVLRGDLSGEPTFREFLKRFREIVLGALSHQEFPFSLLVKRLCPERDASRSPIFQVMFNLQSRRTLGPFADLLAGDDSSDPVDFSGMLLKPFPLEQGAGAFDLIVELIDTGQILKGSLMFNSELFEKETIARMGEHFKTLLQAVACSPDQPTPKIPILPEKERTQLVDAWSATAADYPKDKCVHHLIREQVKRNPNAIAVSCDDDSVTYAELIDRAERLAAYLRVLGVDPGQLVGICMERSIEMVVAMIGVLEAGGAYVPLDPAFPAERNAVMVEDAGCLAILTQKNLLDKLPDTGSKIISVDEIRLDNTHVTQNTSTKSESSESLAYVIYTSGSTGKPKGVEIPHRALVNFLISMQREPGINAKDILLSVTTISFDIFGLELFLPLIAGAQATIVKRDVAADGTKLIQAIEKSDATIMQATPATWRLLLESGWTKAHGLKVLCGGEALSRELADRILDTGAELWNMYGPTETTIWSAVERISKDSKPISIGKPIANTQLYALNSYMEPVPIGVPGELHIGGDGLARGYRNRDDLTQQSFVIDPFANKTGARLYRTGDLVLYLRDGTIQFIGRIDNQVKIRGYRIELGDIEFHFNSHPDVKNSVVTVQEDKFSHKRLVAYYVPFGDRRPSTGEFRDYLSGKLPDYMIPILYIGLDKFPLTPNLKIDRKSLPKPENIELGIIPEYLSPRDETEKALVGIWENVLGVKRVSIRDNFFELGGDSLVAARLFAEIERQFGRNIPLATLFKSPTIEELADSLRKNGQTLLWSVVVPIHTEGTKSPLFLIHGAEGNVLLYRSLQHHLSKDQPVYGLQSEGLDGRKDFQPSVESMASTYLEALKRIQPHGPYFLGGYCMGGTIALEMAQRLRTNGDEVALLAMFETYNLQNNGTPPGKLIHFLFNIQNIMFHALSTLSLQAKDRSAFLEEKLNTELTRLQIRKDVIVSGIKSIFGREETLSYHHVQINKVNDQAQVQYVPQSYSGKITLFRPKRQFVGYPDRYFGWRGIAKDGIDMHFLPFYPRAMLTEPFVRVLAEKLKKSIRNSVAELGNSDEGK